VSRPAPIVRANVPGVRGHVARFMRQDANDFIWRIGNHDRAGIDENAPAVGYERIERSDR